MHRSRPRLKNGVDLQLQSAFSEGNWPVVIRLAEKRAKSLNDPYYEVVKVCAESQVDDPNAKFVALAAVAQYVKDGTTVKDVDSLDLLEWATLDLSEEDDYLDTLGPLRVRAVKAAPKDKHAASRCLESCLIHWDLNSAQQIAAVMDRSFPQERHFMFWNIVITYMLSTNPQAPADKKKLYATLALKQIERAAQAAEQAAASKETDTQPPARSVQKEEEILLLYEITETLGTSEDFDKLVSNPTFGPLTLFRNGQKELFLRVVERQRRHEHWADVFRLCKEALSDKNEDGSVNLLAADYNIWQIFIDAASHITGTDATAAQDVQDLLVKMIKCPSLQPIYKRNILLARVSAAFRLVTCDIEDCKDGQPQSTRLRELTQYVQDQLASPACFDDIKPFVEQLDRTGMIHFGYTFLPDLCTRRESESDSVQVRLLKLKTQYLLATCPLMYSAAAGESSKHTCAACSSELNAAICVKCIQKIWKSGLALYQEVATKTPEQLSGNPQIPPELTLLVAFCSIKIASSNRRGNINPRSPSVARHLFQAILVLEYQLSFSPKNSQMLLVLVQLHLLLGSSPRSRQLWDDLAVKRTIIDSLGPLFYDRLSTVAPHLISPSDNWGWQLMDMLTSHFSYSLKLRMPRRLVDAFEAESYSSILEIPKYISDLRTSATRAMSLVEESRAERLLGAPTWELFTDLRFIELSDDVQLKEKIDYGSFPSWDSSESTPVYSQLRLGSPPSNRRAHLGLLSEAFHDVLGYKPPSAYKVAMSSSPQDQVFAMEALDRISNSMHRFLSGPSTDLTAAEAIYYDVIGLLSTLLPLCAGNSRSQAFEQTFDSLIKAVHAGLGSIQAQVSYGGEADVEKIVALLGSMHSLGVYRDTASAILAATQWIHNFNERVKEKDRSGQSNLPKDVMSAFKSLQSAAEAALKEGRGWVTTVKTHLKGDFQARFKTWVFEGADDLRDVAYEDVVPGLAANIRDNIEGWQQVKWE